MKVQRFRDTVTSHGEVEAFKFLGRRSLSTFHPLDQSLPDFVKAIICV